VIKENEIIFKNSTTLFTHFEKLSFSTYFSKRKKKITKKQKTFSATIKKHKHLKTKYLQHKKFKKTAL